MRLLLCCLVFGCLLVITSGCTVTRWSMHQAKISTSKDDEKERGATNTILLDEQTGDTWLLWPNKAEYKWQKLSK